MSTFREVMMTVNTDSIVLHHTAVNGTSYITSGWAKKDFARLVEDFGDAQVVKIDITERPTFNPMIGAGPEIFLDRNYIVKTKGEGE